MSDEARREQFMAMEQLVYTLAQVYDEAGDDPAVDWRPAIEGHLLVVSALMAERDGAQSPDDEREALRVWREHWGASPAQPDAAASREGQSGL